MHLIPIQYVVEITSVFIMAELEGIVKKRGQSKWKEGYGRAVLKFFMLLVDDEEVEHKCMVQVDDPEYGDITDVNEGTGITLTYTKATKPGAFPQTSLKMRRNSSLLLNDKDAISVLFQYSPDIMSLFERHTPDEINAIIDTKYLIL